MPEQKVKTTRKDLLSLIFRHAQGNLCRPILLSFLELEVSTYLHTY